MREKIRQDKDDIVFEALLKVAADEAMRIEMEALPSNDELKAMYPQAENLSKKINKTIITEYNKSKRIMFFRSLKRIAAAICVFIVLSTSVLMAAPMT